MPGRARPPKNPGAVATLAGPSSEVGVAFPDGTADFRSDTVTRPTPAMYQAMTEAEVGDDVYGEDPTVNALEEEAAAVTGKEAAVFVPTGSMGNQLGISCLTRPGEELLCVETAHVRNYEVGAAAALTGVQFRTVPSEDGLMTPEQVAAAAEAAGYHLPRLSLLVWENSHNVSGGTVVPLEVMESATAVAREAGLRVHLDGARLFNAAVATGVGADRFAAVADTVQFCFSKGLGAPIGSIVCGPSELMAEARYRRKQLGGGMRQVGVIAAAARVALRDRERLAEDHELARYLVAGLASRYPDAVQPERVQTNMLLLTESGLPRPAAELQQRWAARGVRVGAIRPGVLRLVTHRDVDRADADRLLSVLDQLEG